MQTRIGRRCWAQLPWVLAGLLLAGVAAASTATLELVIDLGTEITAGRFDPTRDAVGVRGGGPPLSWQRSVPARPDAASGAGAAVWRVRLHFEGVPEGGRTLAYKFKIERPGRLDDGWEPGRNRSLALVPGAQTLARAYGSEADAPPPQRTGHIERIAPQPSAFVSPREVQVWLPPGYATALARRYPVLYLHDGQNVFDALAVGAEWQVDETAQRLVQAGAVAPFIVVAVASNDDRFRDQTPLPGTAGPRATEGGGAAAYGRYLVQELKPLIDARYRTQPGRDSTAVGGSSLGGLVSMWLLLQHGDAFGAGLVVSPAVWWADNAIVAQVAAAPATTPVPRLWLDVGLDEGHGTLDGARRLRAALQARGWAPAYLEQPGAGHDEAAWAARVESMLRFLYGPPSR
ncbi:MAG: alpha/beta hydrolase [Betaproteobacteria bacterium]|nr:alpha/beta hydrolase [Betaproteobacteria bacterium]